MFGGARLLRKVSGRIGMDADTPDLYGSRNLKAQTSTGTPNTQLVVSFDAVRMRVPSNNKSRVLYATGSFTANILSTGLGGRDQTATFAAGWLHFYIVGGGGPVSAKVSTTAPPGGPTLPPNHDAWAYALPIYLATTGALRRVTARANHVGYQARQVALTSGAAIINTAVSLAVYVPANALASDLSLRHLMAANQTTTLRLRLVTGQDFDVFSTVTAGGGSVAGTRALRVPQTAQQIYYVWSADPGGLLRLTMSVIGYTVPNGGS